MKERSIQEFADKQGLKRQIIHAPGALDSWEKEAAKLTDRKATEIEGFLDVRKVKVNWESENAGKSK